VCGWGARVKLPESASLRRMAQRVLQASAAPQHDRLILALAGLLWLLLMMWVAVPSHRSLDARRAEHREARELLARAKALSATGARSRSAGPDAGAPALISVVNRTAPGFALAFGDFRPEGDARLALGLRGGDFDALLRWLVLLDTRFGIDVVMMDVRPTDTPGRVDAGVTLMWHH